MCDSFENVEQSGVKAQIVKRVALLKTLHCFDVSEKFLKFKLRLLLTIQTALRLKCIKHKTSLWAAQEGIHFYVIAFSITNGGAPT